jgi:galactose mutarotase-like enzyme
MINAPTLLTIAKGASTATINPQGAVLQRWDIGTRNLVFCNPDFQKRASHPCIPVFGFNALPGRPADGSYQIGEKVYKLPRHGFGRDYPWSGKVLEEETSLLRFSYTNMASIPNFSKMLSEVYPFQALFQEAVQLPTPETLNWQLALTNLSDGLAPVDLACHLYLPWEEGFSVKGLVGLDYLDVTDPGNPKDGKITDSGILAAVGHKDWQVDLNSAGRSVNLLVLNYPRSKYFLVMGLASLQGQLGASWPATKVVIWQDPTVVNQIGHYICVQPVLCGRQSFRLRTAAEVRRTATVSLGFSLTYQENPE